MTELDSRGASERDLVLLLGNSGKLDLEKDRDDGGIALEKGDDHGMKLYGIKLWRNQMG